MKHFILFLAVAAVASAQIVSVGVKAGVPATEALPDYFSYSGQLDTGRWTVGPTIEFRLVHGFSVEADALYRGYRQTQSFVSAETTIPAGTNQTTLTTFPAIYSSSHSNTKVWDFPLLMKYRIGSRSYRPFLDAGATFSHSSSDITSSLFCLSSASTCASSYFAPSYNSAGHRESVSANSWGPTAGVGVEFKIGKFKLAPEVRYSHFSNPTRNLVTVMLGFTY